MSEETSFCMKTDEENIYRVIKDEQELYKVLLTCPMECVRFHMRDGGNDFAAWIKGALKNPGLADKVSKVKFNKVNSDLTRASLVQVLKDQVLRQTSTETPKGSQTVRPGFEGGYKRNF